MALITINWFNYDVPDGTWVDCDLIINVLDQNNVWQYNALAQYFPGSGSFTVDSIYNLEVIAQSPNSWPSGICGQILFVSGFNPKIKHTNSGSLSFLFTLGTDFNPRDVYAFTTYRP